MGEQKVVKRIWHDSYPIEITGLTEKGIEKAINDWIKEYKKDCLQKNKEK